MGTAAVVAAIVMTGGPAFAASQLAGQPAASDQGSKVPTQTRVEVPLSAPQALSDALKVRDVDGRPVIAFRFENDEIVGEFAVDGPTPADEYLKEFEESYGTQPQVVAAVVMMPVEEAKTRTLSRSSSQILAPQPAFVAPPADLAKIDALFASRQSRVENTTASRAPMAVTLPTWKPTTADIQVIRSGSTKVYFSQYYGWDGVNAKTSNMSADDGFEMEVNIYTDNYQYQLGARPECTVGYKERPFAWNYNWNWEAIVKTNTGMGSVASNVGAYADYNDLSDDCNRNSIAIGMRTPQVLPSTTGGRQDLMVNITAPRGTEDTGKVSGVVQAVNGAGCVAAPWMALTDCMGLTASSNGSRLTANISNGWIAPNKCWMSNNYGDTPAVAYTGGC